MEPGAEVPGGRYDPDGGDDGPAAAAHPLSVGILQARILEWVDMPSSRGSSQPRD